MDTQEHEYELGTLEENILDRDESQARQSGSRGDERRWMILGGAGTLALLTAIVAAVSLGGAGEARKLSASLPGPVRDLSALSAHLQSSPSDTGSAPEVTPKPRIARAKPSVRQPAIAAPVVAAPVVAAPVVAAPVVAAPVVAAPEATTTAAVSTPAPVTRAAVAETAETSFANLPTVSAAEDAAADATDAVDPAEVVPTNFEQDDDPFAEDPSESNDESAVVAEVDEPGGDEPGGDEPSDDEGEMDAPVAEVPAPAEAPGPAEAPPPANDVAFVAPTPA